MRINKLLSNYGICSRKDANKIIEDERVIVNGVLAFPGQWVEEYDDILLDGEKLIPKEKIYIVLNKPVGVTCTAAKEVKNNIIDYISISDYIFPVGRLDKESEGLILLTNDGDLANDILEAENEKEKEYIVTVDKEIGDTFIKEMSEGVNIGNDIITKPCYVEKLSDDTFKIVLTQGLNRQIRKMSKSFGYNVIKLQRVRILNLLLDEIEYGKWRMLTYDEIEELKKITNK